MNNEQIPESVMQEWIAEGNELVTGSRDTKLGNISAHQLNNIDLFVKGCKSQYSFREKYEKLHKVLEKADDELNTLLAFGDESAQQFAIKLKSIIHQAL